MVVGIYKQTAKDIMTKRVETLRQRDTIHYALMMMAEFEVSAIPVVDPAGKVYRDYHPAGHHRRSSRQGYRRRRSKCIAA